MKPLILFTLLALGASPRGCRPQKPDTIFEGRLEIKGICSNYTIKLLEPEQASWAQANWTDEQTGKKHTNVFRMQNPCALPDTIKEGAEFYFRVDTTKQERCTVCMAYYPTPEKAVAIKIVPRPAK